MWIRHERLPTGTRPSRAAPLLLPLHLIREITKMHFEMRGVTRNVEQIWRHEENPSCLHRMARCQRQIRSRQSRASAHCGARNHVRNTGYKKKKIAAELSTPFARNQPRGMSAEGEGVPLLGAKKTAPLGLEVIANKGAVARDHVRINRARRRRGTETRNCKEQLQRGTATRNCNDKLKREEADGKAGSGSVLDQPLSKPGA